MPSDDKARSPANAPRRDNLKHKVAHELEEFSVLALYLALFFSALATYSMVLLKQFHISFFAYGTALLDAVVIAKVIMLGDAIHVGTKYDDKTLLISAIWKAFVFAWLVFGFRVVEETIKGLWHGQSFSEAFHVIRSHEMFVRTFLIFVFFIPLFIIRGLVRMLRQVTGEEHLRTNALDTPTRRAS
jgi:hypothetical protein